MSEPHAYEALQWTLQDRMLKALHFAGKSNQDIAHDLGVHRNTIANYLGGRTPIDRRTIMAWALATGVPVDWLESGKEPSGGGDGPEGQAAGSSTALRELTDAKRQRTTRHTRQYTTAALAA